MGKEQSGELKIKFDNENHKWSTFSAFENINNMYIIL